MSIVVVNNVQGKTVSNIRGSLRQGDLPSMHLFSYGIDPLLNYLEKRLHGIVIASTPVQGPVPFLSPPLLPFQERYKVIGYADDVKPAITTMEEFMLVDKAMLLFEQSSGCKLHRHLAAGPIPGALGTALTGPRARPYYDKSRVEDLRGVVQ